jgi:three-Cys-motif partner protein
VAVDPNEFCDDKQGAAVLKHGILKRYLAVFASKVGSTARDHKVMYLDAYAGPGEYGGGAEGSPAIARATAQYLAKNRNLVGIYVEKDEENLEKLKKFLEGSPHEHYILEGNIEDHFDTVLKLVGDAPLIAFFDPFGLTVPMERLRALMERKRRDGSPIQAFATTELIINVSYPGIARVCGIINSEKAKTNERVAKQRESLIQRANERLGGEWWQPIAIERASDWVEKIAHGYAQRLHDVMGVGFFRVPISDRPDGGIAYELLLISRYTREAHWHFHEQVSLGNQDLRAFLATGAQQQELPIDESMWVGTIKAHLMAILRKGEFWVREKWVDVFGDETFGLARTTHVRKAIKELHKEGVTLCDGKKKDGRDLPDLLITKGPNLK